MIEVEVRGDLEYAIRQLKKKLQIDGIKRELKRREKARRDRTVGMSEYQYSRVHQHGIYDVEVDTSTMSTEKCVNTIKTYLYSGAQPQAFFRLQESDDI